MVKIGIIGGSGLDNPKFLENSSEIDVDTPYGKPSSTLKTGKISGVDVVLLARHGREHTVPPTQVNFRANIWALKEAGCDYIIATTAVGSLKEEIERGDLVIVDQFIDFTRHRQITFFDKFEPGKAKHTPMAEPFSSDLRIVLNNACEELGLRHHKKGSVVTIEGPRFSTKAESHMFRTLGADIINMSIAPEACLANEVGIPYAAVAMSTDYDCIFDDIPPVTWDEILKVFGANVEKVTNLILKAIPKLTGDSNLEIIKSKIRTIPDFPKPGIQFRDVTTLFKDEEGFNLMIDELVKRYEGMDIDSVAGIEARGFITGSILAHKLGKGFIAIRKPGKLPGDVEHVEYTTEYSTDKIEVHKGSVKPNEKVLLVDDLIATGGSALAGAQLIQKLGGQVVECSFIIDLPALGGKKRLEDQGLKCFNLIDFEGD